MSDFNEGIERTWECFKKEQFYLSVHLDMNLIIVMALTLNRMCHLFFRNSSKLFPKLHYS